MKYGEKKAGTSRENPFLKQVYVLLGGYAEENYVVPVQLEVKEMEDQSENRLYLSVVLTKIAPEVLEKALSGKPGSIPRLFSDAKISIADIFRNVNRSLPTRERGLKFRPLLSPFPRAPAPAAPCPSERGKISS